MDDKWQVECDANDLLRAEEIKKDKSRYQKALAHLKKKAAAINSIEGLRQKAKEVQEAEDAEEEKEDPYLEPESGVNINIRVKSGESLMTEEDKASIQEQRAMDKKYKEMGLKVE